MILSDLKEQSRAKIIGLNAGRYARKRLLAMGLTIGEEIKIINNTGQGAILINVRDTKLGIGRGLAMKVTVEEIKEVK